MIISDFPLCKPMDLCVQDIIISNAFLKINKITKLILRKISAVQQIDLMLDLFPRVYYFGLEDVLDADLEIFFRCILLNIKGNNIPHPKTICIVTTDATCDKVSDSDSPSSIIFGEAFWKKLYYYLLNDYSTNHSY
jgi:hypothetical protein